jgi:hypothetical protein
LFKIGKPKAVSASFAQTRNPVKQLTIFRKSPISATPLSLARGAIYVTHFLFLSRIECNANNIIFRRIHLKSCNCKNGVQGATGAAGVNGAHSIADLLHIVNTLPEDPLPGELYFVQSENTIYMGDQLIFGEVPDVESFAFTVQTYDGTFQVPVYKIAGGEDIPYNWNIYVDDLFYTTVSGVSSSIADSTAVAATISDLDTAPHVIRIEPVAEEDGWLVAFGQIPDPENTEKIIYCNSKFTKKSIAANNTTIASYALGLFFFYASNLTLGPDFGFTTSCDDFTAAGDYFAGNFMNLCASVTALPANFNFPQNLVSVGDSFARGMFTSCVSLAALPNGFNFPQNITTVGDDFAMSMFRNCSDLTTLPTGFNFPQNISTAGNNFAWLMFENCAGLTALPAGFTLPQSLTTVGDSFAISLFENCSSLTAFPAGFNLPQNLTSVGDDFAYGMVMDCTSLSALPAGFNLPQNITTVGMSFASSMFHDCTSLADLPTGFTFPQGITTCANGFATGMFHDCTSLATLPVGFNLPQYITSVGNYFLQNMFNGCTNLSALPAGFNLPQSITTTAATYFADALFLNCTNLLVDSAFKFNPAMTATGSYSYTFFGVTAAQNVTAASIINGTPTPSSPIATFKNATGFLDYDELPTNWKTSLS